MAQREVVENAVSKSSKPWFVYVLLCENQSFYVGATSGVRKRFADHLSGQGARWTKLNKPVRIVHHEEFPTSDEAFAREKELKTGFGRKWIKREFEADRLNGLD
jgi:predicted GIY-YIG superfamily endonuclease